MYSYYYLKTVITFADADGLEVGEWAFCDARRLGRIKLIDAEVPEEAEVLRILGEPDWSLKLLIPYVLICMLQDEILCST